MKPWWNSVLQNKSQCRYRARRSGSSRRRVWPTAPLLKGTVRSPWSSSAGYGEENGSAPCLARRLDGAVGVP